MAKKKSTRRASAQRPLPVPPYPEDNAQSIREFLARASTDHGETWRGDIEDAIAQAKQLIGQLADHYERGEGAPAWTADECGAVLRFIECGSSNPTRCYCNGDAGKVGLNAVLAHMRQPILTREPAQDAPAAEALTFKPLPDLDRKTVDARRWDIETLVYQAKSIAGAAQVALREIDGGEGAVVDGCLEALQDLLVEAERRLDHVVLFAPAETQEVSHE